MLFPFFPNILMEWNKHFELCVKEAKICKIPNQSVVTSLSKILKSLLEE